MVALPRSLLWEYTVFCIVKTFDVLPSRGRKKKFAGAFLTKPMVKIATSINCNMYFLVFHVSDSIGLGSRLLLEGNSTPKLLLLLCKVYKKSFPSVLLFLHSEKQVESCGQKSYLYCPSLRSDRALSSWCVLMSQTGGHLCVCVSSVYAKLSFYRKQLSLDFDPILVQW